MSKLVAPFRLSLPFVRVLLADLGMRAADLLDAAGLPGDLLNGAEALLTPSQYYSLFRRVGTARR